MIAEVTNNPLTLIQKQQAALLRAYQVKTRHQTLDLRSLDYTWNVPVIVNTFFLFDLHLTTAQ